MARNAAQLRAIFARIRAARGKGKTRYDSARQAALEEGKRTKASVSAALKHMESVPGASTIGTAASGVIEKLRRAKKPKERKAAIKLAERHGYRG